jgi:NADH pyrophosphatase NudC (nudix superfamily)
MNIVEGVLPFSPAVILAAALLSGVALVIAARIYQWCPHCGHLARRVFQGWKRCRHCGRQYRRGLRLR